MIQNYLKLVFGIQLKDNLSKILYLPNIFYYNLTYLLLYLQAFNSNLEISNFPMRERIQEFVRMLDTIKKRRAIEIAEAKVGQCVPVNIFPNLYVLQMNNAARLIFNMLCF